MFKRLLAYTLAGCLVFDAAPVTSYAAGLQTGTAMESSEQTADPVSDVSGGEAESEEESASSEENTSAESGEESTSAESEESTPAESGEESTPAESEESTPAESEESTPAGTEEESLPAPTEEESSEATLTDEMQGYNNPAEENAAVDADVVSEEGSEDVKLPLTKQEDGSYTFEMEANRVTLKIAEGCAHFRILASMEAGEEGQELTGSYVLRAYYRAENSSYTNNEGRSLYTYNGYSVRMLLSADSGKQYSMYFTLTDASGNIILAQTEEITLRTKEAGESVIVHSSKSAETEIVLDVETVGWDSYYCYYAPTDGSGEEQRMSVSGWDEYAFSNLRPGTEYYFQFTDSEGRELFRTTASTAASTDTTAVIYAVTPGSDATDFGFSLKADVSGYKGDATRATLYYTYTDSLGMKQSGWAPFPIETDDGSVTVGEDGAKSFTVAGFVDGNWGALEADTKYDITMWLGLYSDAAGWTELEEKTLTVQTPGAVYKAEDITLTLAQNEDSDTTVDYTVTRPARVEDEQVMGRTNLYYRQKGDREDYSLHTLYYASSTGSVSNLQRGAEYEFVLFAGGVKIAKTYTCPAGIKLSPVGEGENNAFDIVRTWKAEGTEALTGNYYLCLYQWNGSSYQRLGSTAVLNEDNSWQKEFGTASVRRLDPDTDYDLKWTLGSTEYAPIYTLYETVHTAKADIAIEDAGSTYDSQSLKIALNQAGIANFADSFGSLQVYAFIRKAGNGTYRYRHYEYLSDDEDYSGTIAFGGLEPETAYEVSLRSANTYSSSIEYAAYQFTTSKDERAVTVTGTDAKLHRATLSYTLSGIPSTMTEYGYVACYIREKDGEGAWEQAGYTHSYTGTSYLTGSFDISRYKGVELKDNTTYEYEIGLASSYNPLKSRLEKVAAGEFTTLEDKRSLSGAGVSAGYTIAQAGVSLSGNEYGTYSYVYFFYKEKSASDWIQAESRGTSNTSYTFSVTFSGLKAGTEYDYAMVLSDSYSCNSPDEVTKDSRKALGSFATRKSTYTLSFAHDESKLTHNKAVVAVTAQNGTDDSRIEAVLTLNDGQSRSVILKQSTGYKQNVTFSELLGKTEYTITKAELRVTEGGQSVTIAELPCDYKFTTKEAQAPTAIKLSADAIGLNAAYAYVSYEGYNKKTLKVTAEPLTAAADVIWESSNPEVAAVYGGVVYAQGAGEATITATSRYDQTVKASCAVTVKNYVVGYVAAAGAEPEPYYYDETGSLFKGGYVSGLGLYEQSGTGALTAVTGYSVTVGKPGIASWEDDRVKALSVGSTRIYMEKDGVQASFTIRVTAAGKGFGITGFTDYPDYGYDRYPAVSGADANSYVLACVPGVTYSAVGEISPAQDFDPSDFTWSVSNDSVATVSDMGVVTPLKAGTATLTVTPKVFHTLQGIPYVQDKVEITLQIKALPEQESESIYALANTAGKLGDVAFPAKWGEGWSWKYPGTPLVTNGVNSDGYRFEAVYSDTKSGAESRYPCETTLTVYIGRITGMSARDVSGHKQVLEVSTGSAPDTLSLAVNPFSQGRISSESYVIEIPDVAGLTVTKNAATGYYDVTAQKAGTYTLNPVIKSKDTNAVLAKTSCTIKAVEDKQAAAITFKLDDSSVAGGVTISNGKIIFNKVDDKKDFTLTATVTDRDGKELDTALQWKTTDKSVAVVAEASKQDSHTAKVTVKGEGHAVLTATAKDAQGLSATLSLEVQNHRPRVDTAKASVNIAYDYESWDGKALASAAGLVEIVPVYGESVKSVKLCDENGQVRTDLRADSYSGSYYLIVPTAAEIATGTFNCKLVVTTSADAEYTYDLKVSVTDKAPSVSAKMGSAPNLFFTDSVGRINLTIAGNNRVQSVVWEDQSEGVQNGFAMDAYYYTNKNKYVSYIEVTQQSGLRVTNGKLSDTGVEKGTLRVKVRGFRKEYTFADFKIKSGYKKPSLVTTAASTNVSPSVGQNSGRFYCYDKTNKRYLYFSTTPYSNYYFDELTWDCEEDVALSPSGSQVTYDYFGREGSTKKLTMTLDSPYWREPLKTVHTIKAIKPQAYLTYSQLTYNTAVKSTATTQIFLKNNTFAINNYADIVIEGANQASKNLTDKDLLIITASNSLITVQQSDAKIMGETIPAGTYSYKVTPYYENPETGVRTALNTMPLKVKVVNKPVTAKVSPKGALDLTYGAASTPSDKKNIAVLVDPKFANCASGYGSPISYRLTGEYSDYFRLDYGRIWYGGKRDYHYYITARDNSVRKLKAGQTYKLAIEYTFNTRDGETFTVTSNTFKIKPKQTTAKVTVTGNNQTLYAGSALTRTYRLSVPDYYTISGASGSIDCNKDGRADITVSGGSTLTVRITDADAVGASASGKSYSIPVTVKLSGRDGVNKDVKITIKVKVKR